MTTDLTGDFGLGEDEFDWDVFLPDPDESEIAAEAAALEDEAELDLDDSDFDWEAALREDGEPENGADNSARAGAAYERIVDMVRRSFEEETEETDLDGVAEVQPVALQESETLVPAEAEDELEAERVSDLVPEDEAVPEGEPVPDEELAPEGELTAHDEFVTYDEREPEDAPAWGSAFTAPTEPDPEPAAATASEGDPLRDLEPEMLIVADPDLDLAPDPGQGSDLEPEPELAPFSALAEPTAAAPLVWTEEAAPDTPTDPESTWATVPATPEVDAGDDEPFTDAVGAEGDERVLEPVGEEKKQRSRVFTAAIVLACLFVVVVAAVLGMRALRHQTTTATAPPVTAAPPARTAPTLPTSQDVARIQTATDAVDSATTAASVGVASMTAFPTPTSVATIMNPYIASLQLYETVLSGSKVPAAARPAVASAQTQLRQDLQFLDTIDGLPAAQLGAYLAQFDSDATHLQTTLSTLEQNLRAPAS
jgi:hypothetical protein